MKPKSDSLFHFTPKFEYLKSILLKGFHPRFCLEDLSWFDGIPDYVAYPMVCFCDIPISRVSDHTSFYGQYGLGLTKAWGLKNRLTPVMYVTPDSAVVKAIDFLAEQPRSEDGKGTEFSKNLYRMMASTKPITGTMQIGGKDIEKDFYQENEWRYNPTKMRFIKNTEFDQYRDAANTEMEECKIEFLPQDVKYIFVKYDHEIPELVDFINTNLGELPQNHLKILITRILSLETITADL